MKMCGSASKFCCGDDSEIWTWASLTYNFHAGKRQLRYKEVGNLITAPNLDDI